MAIQPQVLAQIIEAHCKSRQLRQALPQLCWDVLLLVQRAKPAVLLDYAFTDAKPLVSLLKALQPASGVQLALLSWSSHCHIICNVQQTLERLDAALTAESACADPLMIGFAAFSSTTGLSPYFLDPASVKAVLSGLQPLQQWLVASLPAPGVAVVDLEQLVGLPVMPTLNGWLLGYPIIYVVKDVDESQLAAKCLSTTDITVCQVKSKAMPEGGKTSLQAGETLFPAGLTLSAFSVPTHLLRGNGCEDKDAEHAEAELHPAVDAWLNHICNSLHGDGWEAQVLFQCEDRGLQPVSL